MGSASNQPRVKYPSNTGDNFIFDDTGDGDWKRTTRDDMKRWAGNFALASMQDLVDEDLDRYNDEDVVLVENFYPGADGGGDPFRWDANGDKADHNGITIIDPTHSTTPGASGWWTSENTGTTGVFKRREKGFFTLFDAGAKGDGTTSDDAAINGLITASSTGDKIIVPNGTFIVNDTIIPKTDQVWEFYGWIKLDDQGDSSIVTLFNLTQSNVTLINPLLDMDYSNNTDGGGNGIYSVLNNGDGARIYGGILKNSFHNIYQGVADNFRMYGTTLDTCGEHGIYISDSAINKADMLFDGITIKNIGFDTTQDEAHYVQAQYIEDLRFNNIYCEGANGTIPNFAFSLNEMNNFKCSNSIFKNINHSAIDVSATVSNVRLDNCDFFKPTPLVPSVCDSEGTNVKISKCYFDGFAQTNPAPDEGFYGCYFDDIYTPFDGSNYTLYKDCKFIEGSGGLSRFWGAVSGKAQDFIDCEFVGDPTSGLEFFDLDVGERIYIENIRFNGHSSNNTILINSGQNHTIKGVIALDSASSSSIDLRSANYNEVLIAECLLGGDISDGNTGVTTTYGNRTNV